VKALPVEKLNERLDDMFRLLTGGSRTALPRQQTLQALIDWSYDLLAPPEKALLRRLSVFTGGWTLEAAEGVCVGEGVEEWEVLDRLTSLVEKSLVLYEEQSGEGRYRLLETVRQYARDRLLEEGEADAVRARHAEYFLQLAERAEPELHRHEQIEWLDRLGVEHDNLRAALAWTRARGQGEEGLRLGGALWSFWVVRGYLGEGREHLARLLALPGAEARTAARARALHGAGILAMFQGNYGATRTLLEESLAISREFGYRRDAAWSLGYLGIAVRDQGDCGAARALFEESLAIFREVGSTDLIAWSLGNLGLAARDQGDCGTARALFEESLAIFRELGNKRAISASMNRLGMVAHDQGDYGAARALLTESLAISWEVGHRGGLVRDLEGLAAVAVAQAQFERAARLFGGLDGLREAIGQPRAPVARSDYERSVTAARARLGEETFAAAWEEGRAMSLQEAVALALDEGREA
jgi:tetratricopeptide (TPR) repeat protein